MNAMKLFRYATSEPYSGSSFTDEGKRYGYEKCQKCSGQGVIMYFAHNESGRCFSCQGDKVVRFRLYTEDESASQIRRIERASQKTEERAHITREIVALQSLKNSVRQGLWNIKKLHEKAASNFVGSIGDRIEVVVTVQFCMGFDGFYGTTYINTMVDAEGNIYVYKGKRLASKGDHIKLKATIKDHSEYKGAKQTVVNRPMIMGDK